MLLDIPTIVEDAAHFHDIANYNVENHIIPHINPIVRILAFFGGVVWFKGFRTGSSLPNGLLDGINQLVSRYGILQAIGNIIHNA